MKRPDWQDLRDDEAGVTAIEYALLAGIVTIGVLATMQGAGIALRDVFLSLCDLAAGVAGGSC